MSGGADEQDKSHEPTEKKLQDARRKGELARSTDLNTAAAYTFLLLAVSAFGPTQLLKFGEITQTLLARPERLAPLVFDAGGGAVLGGLLSGIAGTLALFFLLPALGVIGAIVVQQSLVFAPDKLKPKLSRISPLSNARNKFGRAGLFEFAKSTVKLVVYAALLAVYLKLRSAQILAAMQLSARPALAAFFQMGVEFLTVCAVIAVSIGAIDYLWQYFEHRRKNRMSHQELKDEFKQTEGDPHAKQQRRQRGTEIAMNRMLADVPGADVVIVNPTHYAVALKWERGTGSAPVCVAKGVDEIAARIRESAAEFGVPVYSDPPTARALHATVKLGQEIQPDHYQAVAAAVRFADQMRQKARKR
ncbi:EscU/YscU/HrcU family type III secretion system export apparatus switch protein [Actibacterium ureilyticum]|uniref:EscU/YscU/HrcU family type III secretion system export apparatus switch protein n=1 Tax=Actibacterium ureilyticum TaxID=1590614 RepID=UPI000BAB2462|nr:flagellar type III secretion system protein FlhB [Actibacterium ureilyticum]